MPRKKEQEEVVVYGEPAPPNSAVVQVEASPLEPPDTFKSLFAVAPSRPNLRGRLAVYDPLYLPQGVKLSFRLAPGSTDYQQAKMEGWVPLPPELVCDDPDRAAAEGKVALLHYDIVDGFVRVGPHVAMVKPYREWYERYMADVERMESIQNYASLGVKVDEQTSHEV